MNEKTVYIPIMLDPSIPAHEKELRQYEQVYKPLGITKEQWALDKVVPDSDHAQAIELEIKARQPAIGQGQARMNRGSEV